MNYGQKTIFLPQIWAIHLVRGSKPERKYKIELFIGHLSTYQAEKQAKVSIRLKIPNRPRANSRSPEDVFDRSLSKKHFGMVGKIFNKPV